MVLKWAQVLLIFIYLQLKSLYDRVQLKILLVSHWNNKINYPSYVIPLDFAWWGEYGLEHQLRGITLMLQLGLKYGSNCFMLVRRRVNLTDFSNFYSGIFVNCTHNWCCKTILHWYVPSFKFTFLGTSWGKPDERFHNPYFWRRLRTFIFFLYSLILNLYEHIYWYKQT